MLSRVRRYVSQTIDRVARDHVGPALEDGVARAVRRLDPSPAIAQVQLRLAYRALVDGRRPLPSLRDVGFSVNSQSDEDGILLFLFSVIGVSTRRCVEICAGDGIESNTANLILNHGWHGLLADGEEASVERGRRFFAESPFTYVYPPVFVCSWVTRSNITELLRTNGFSGEIDLLSLDLDGVEYWIWDALDGVRPRIVVVEYADILGPDRSWTVPYADDFCALKYPMTAGTPNFTGASLQAYVKLARRKGYRLVGVNRYGYNAFFVQNGLADDLIPEIDPRDCFSHPKVVWGMRERFPTVRDLPWVEV